MISGITGTNTYNLYNFLSNPDGGNAPAPSSLDSLGATLSDLQAAQNTNLLQTDPTLAHSVVFPDNPSLESMASTMGNLQEMEAAGLEGGDSLLGAVQAQQDGLPLGQITGSSLPLESFGPALSTLQAMQESGMLQNNPSVAQSIIGSGFSSSSLESLAAGLDNLQSIENANVLQDNPALAQSILQGYVPSANPYSTSPASTPPGSSVNTIA